MEDRRKERTASQLEFSIHALDNFNYVSCSLVNNLILKIIKKKSRI